MPNLLLSKRDKTQGKSSFILSRSITVVYILEAYINEIKIMQSQLLYLCQRTKKFEG